MRGLAETITQTSGNGAGKMGERRIDVINKITWGFRAKALVVFFRFNNIASTYKIIFVKRGTELFSCCVNILTVAARGTY